MISSEAGSIEQADLLLTFLPDFSTWSTPACQRLRRGRTPFPRASPRLYRRPADGRDTAATLRSRPCSRYLVGPLPKSGGIVRFMLATQARENVCQAS